MSDEKNTPQIPRPRSAPDNAIEIFPVFMDKGDMGGNVTDFRPVALPAEAQEEEVPSPKVSAVQEPVDSSDSLPISEPSPPETIVPEPVAKASTQPKVRAPGKPASSSPQSPGKNTQSAESPELIQKSSSPSVAGTAA